MFKLVNSDLPPTPVTSKGAIPLVQAFAGIGGSAPICRVDFFSIYGEGVTPEVTELSDPIAIAQLYEIKIPFSFSAIKISDFSETDPISISPQRFFWDEQNLAIASNKETSALTALVVVVAASPSILNDNYLVQISSWENFTATKVSTGGLIFTPSNTGAAGTFQQNDDKLILYPDPLALPRDTDAVLIEATYTFETGIPSCTIVCLEAVTDFVDYIEYLGLTFSPARNAFQPQINEFVWDGLTAALFMENWKAQGLRVKSQSLSGRYQKKIGKITY